MRRSSERHPLAILRRIIGLSQPEFAQLMDMSESTLSKIESLRLSLSVDNALLIESETGCAATWLRAGDVTAPPYAAVSPQQNSGGTAETANPEEIPYTFEIYQWARGRRQAGLPLEDSPDAGPDYCIALAIQNILLACSRAEKTGKRNVARLKLYNIAQKLCREMGMAQARDDDAADYVFDILDAVYLFMQVDRRKQDE